METVTYQIVPSVSGLNRYLSYFSSVKVLKNIATNKIFARYTLVDKSPINPPQGWLLGEINLPSVYVKAIDANNAIDSVADEFGNVYYDVTEEFSELA
jgi:hypothetical protein